MLNLSDLHISQSHCLIQSSLKLVLYIMISTLNSLNFVVQHFKLLLDLGLERIYFTSQFFNIHCRFRLLVKRLVSILKEFDLSFLQA